MDAKIIKYDPESEFFIEEGCHIIELLSEPGEHGMSVARARVETGAQTAWHRLKDVTERYLIVEGRGVVEVGDLPAAEVTPGDVVIIPADTDQRIRNIGDCDLIFLCICSPRYTPESYIGM